MKASGSIVFSSISNSFLRLWFYKCYFAQPCEYMCYTYVRMQSNSHLLPSAYAVILTAVAHWITVKNICLVAPELTSLLKSVPRYNTFNGSWALPWLTLAVVETGRASNTGIGCTHSTRITQKNYKPTWVSRTFAGILHSITYSFAHTSSFIHSFSFMPSTGYLYVYFLLFKKRR